MRVSGHFDDVAGGGDEFDADELVGRQSPGAHHPADAAAEREPADTDRGGVAGADAELVIGEYLGDVAPHGAAADAHERAVDVDVVQCREVEGQSARHGAPGAVAAAAHDDRNALARRPSHGTDHVGNRIGAYDQVGFAAAGMEAPCRLPFVVTGRQHAPGENRIQLIDPHRTDATGGCRHGKEAPQRASRASPCA